MPGIQYIFGGGAIREGRGFGSVEALHSLFDILEKNGCKKIDTAALYGESEEYLGKAAAADRFVIDTKTKGGFAGSGYASKENIVKEAEHSKKMLKHDVDVFYIHAPDEDTPLEHTLEGINEVYKKGFFKRFGLSNYKAEDVEKVYNHCKEKGYPLPSVYQGEGESLRSCGLTKLMNKGNYSPVARKQEDLLFPTLRKLGISFFAYSPIAGGFLTKTAQEIKDGKGRFNTNEAIGQVSRSHNLLNALPCRDFGARAGFKAWIDGA